MHQLEVRAHDVTMVDLPDAKAITGVASLLAPGLIISVIRTRAITGSLPDIKDRLVSYALISTAYFAVATPLLHVPWGVPVSDWTGSVLQAVVWPILVGIFLAYLYQWKASYRIAKFAKLNLAHHLPAAWDYVFESITEGTFIIVTLQDGTQIAGKMAKDSFASSSRDERDLFIQEMWSVGAEDESWTPLKPPRGILICGRNIKSVEIF